MPTWARALWRAPAIGARHNPSSYQESNTLGQHVELKAADGHTLDAYVAAPQEKPRGAIVVVQEIFGVNHHIRSVADRFAAEGYVAIAPALFDRFERGVELNYDGADMQKAVSFVPRLNLQQHTTDVGAAVEYVHSKNRVPVGEVGSCLRGNLPWLAATTGDTLLGCSTKSRKCRSCSTLEQTTRTFRQRRSSRFVRHTRKCPCMCMRAAGTALSGTAGQALSQVRRCRPAIARSPFWPST